MEDDTLMAIYPKIRGIPEELMKAKYKGELTKIINANTEHETAMKNAEKALANKERAEFNDIAEKMLKQEKVDNEIKRKDLLMRNLETQKTQIQQIV